MDNPNAVESSLRILESEDRELVALLRQASELQLRSVAERMVYKAIELGGLRGEAFEAVKSGDRNPELLEMLKNIAEDYDSEYLDKVDPNDARNSQLPEVLTAFKRARAASAVAEAITGEPRAAAVEALYELYYAFNDKSVLIAAREALGI